MCIMHRDIKLENIIFENEKTTKIILLDFGLAENTQKPNLMI